MSVLTAAVAVVGATSLLNLILLYGVIRRLRAAPAPVSGAAGTDLAAAVAPFTATAVDGAEVSAGSLAEGTPVGFFIPGCDPCRELLPRFVAALRDHGGEVLAVVAGGEGREQYVAELATVATVVAGAQAEPVVEAFGVTGYPALCRIGAGGAIHELDRDLHGLRDVVRA